MKRIFAMMICLCMAVAAFPAYADNGGTDNGEFRVLLDENFESGTTALQKVNVSAGTAEIENSAADAEYGQGEKVFAIKDANASPYVQLAFDGENKLTKSLRGGVHKEDSETYGYGAELSFDWNPNNYNAGAPVSYIGLSGRSEDSADNIGQFMFLVYTGGDKETSGRTLSIGNRSGSTEKQIDLSKVLGSEIYGSDHAYRVRLVIKPFAEIQTESGKNYAGTIDIYMDGVFLYTFKYQDNAKENYIYGLFYRTNKPDSGTLDNIRLTDFWGGADSVPSEDYIDDDLLITAIRRCEYKLKDLSDAAYQKLSEAIAAAKNEFELPNRSQASVDAAFEALCDAEEAINKPMPPEPADEFGYIVNNDYEGEADSPFRGAAIKRVNDDAAFIKTAWKISGSVDLTSEVFEGVDIASGSKEPNGTDSITEFDIKFENFCESGASLMLTQQYDKTPDGTPIAVITFQKGKIMKANGGDGTQTTLAENVYSDGEWHRIRIVQHAVDSVGAFPQNMSMYVDGVCIGDHFSRRSTTAAKTKYYNQILMSGLGDGVSAYIDNFRIYKVYDGLSDCPLDMGAAVFALRNMQTFLQTAVVGDNIGEYDADDYALVKSSYESGTEKINDVKSQDEAELLAKELNAVLNSAAPNRGIVSAEKTEYSSDRLQGAAKIEAKTTVKTSRLADEENDILMLSALYKNSENYPGGEMISVSAANAKLGRKDFAELKAEIDLGEFSEEEKKELYIKTYILCGKEKNNLINANGDAIGNVKLNSGKADELYGAAADIFKKQFADGKTRFSLSVNTKKDDRIMVYAVKKQENESIDINDINSGNAKERLSFFNIQNAGENGNSVFCFEPKEQGFYRVVAYSGANGKIFDRECVFTGDDEIKNLIQNLKSGSADIAAKASELDLNVDMFEKCAALGIDRGSITRKVFSENQTVDAYIFKTEYLKYMNLLCCIKGAAKLDTVAETLEKYGLRNSLDSYKWNQICEYVYKNKDLAVTFEALEKLLAYEPRESGSGGNNGGGSGGGGGGGSRGSGYLQTAAVDEKTKDSPAPYEKAKTAFSDISGVSWAEEAIVFLAENNVINGKEDGIFAPNDEITREEFAKIVVNMFAKESEQIYPSFSDADKDAWYWEYIVKAFSLGIIKGVDENTFGIGMSVSREDAIVMLFRAGSIAGAVYSDKAEFIPFEDGCSDYAREAVETLAKSGIVNGMGNNVLGAKKSLTRAEAANMIYKLYCFISG